MAAALAALLTFATAGAAAAKPWIGVEGNHLVDGAGRTVRLLGVSRSPGDASEQTTRAVGAPPSLDDAPSD